MSSTALEIDTPQLCATQLVANPGSLPTITVPVTSDGRLDVEGTLHYLRAAADFFAVPMASLAEFVAAISGCVAAVERGALMALNVTIVAAGGVPQVIVSGARVHRIRREAVRILVDDSVLHAHRTTDPWWRRMAARTTSRGDVDQLERWLNGRGFADCVTDGVPHLGVLVYELGSGALVAVENPEPTSILGQLEQCGVITTIERVPACPRQAHRAWWISPRYEVHPVADVDGSRLKVAPEMVPQFTRWS